MSHSKNPLKNSSFSSLRKISYKKLLSKYSSGKYSYDIISINNLVFNETCLVTAKFKDFLIYDDNTEFIRKFLSSKDTNIRLKRILIFYETYSKIFPNYLVIEENKYLYRNIRKKQKMIDAINEIKREENENKKLLKEKCKVGNKNLNDNNELFTPKIKEEIKTFQNNISFKNYKNSFDSNKDENDTLLINRSSFLNPNNFKKDLKVGEESVDNNWGTIINTFIANETNGSLSGVINILNDNKINSKDLPNILNYYKKSIYKKEIINDNKKKINEVSKNKITKKSYNNANIFQQSLSKKKKNKIESKIKKIDEKINLYKYAKYSTNVTNSSSILSKMLKNQITNSSVSKNNKQNKESDKNIIYTATSINPNFNIKNNIYTKTSPKKEQFIFKKHFYKTTNNFNIKKMSLKKNKSEKKEKNKNSIPNYIIKKKQYSKTNSISKIKEKILANKNELNFYTEKNNHNLITGDKTNNKKNNKKNFSQDKVYINVRDIIKINKEKDNINKSIKQFQTAQKLKTHKKEYLKLTKSNTNKHIYKKSFNFNENKNNKILYNKQKIESKIKNNLINKKLMTGQQKSKTSSIFNKNKNIIKKNKNIKTEENSINEKNNKKILDIKKYVSNGNYPKIESNSKSEINKEIIKEILPNLSNSNSYKIKINSKDNQSRFKSNNTINNILKNNKYTSKYFSSLNNSSKKISNKIKKQFKSFLIKNRAKAQNSLNHSSQKNILFVDIFNRMKKIKKNKLNSNFSLSSKTKNFSEININMKDSKNIKLSNKMNLLKTPSFKNNKIEIYKKSNTNRKLNNFKDIKSENDNIYPSSFFIKVNRTNRGFYNKDKNEKEKRKI